MNKRGKSILAIVLVLLVSFALACSPGGGSQTTTQPTTLEASDDASLAYVTARGSLILGLDEEFPPMGFRDDSGEIVGFDIDVAKAVAAKLGIELKLQPIDWDSKDLELSTKNIDCIWNGFSITEERQANMTLSIPYLENEMALVVRADSGYKTATDLAGKQIAVQAGSSARDAYDKSEAMKETRLIEVDDNVRALLELETKSVDAVLMDDVAARYYITQNAKDFVVLDESLESEQYAIGFRKGEVALKEAIDGALRELKSDGTIAAISTKWFGSDTTIIE